MDILIIEDVPDDRELLKSAFSKYGRGSVSLRFCSTLDGALEEIASSKPELLLVDIHLPKEDGFQIVEALQAESRVDFPIVFLTVSTSEAHAARAYDLGALGFCTKPVGEGGMKLTVQQIIGLYNAYWRNRQPNPI